MTILVLLREKCSCFLKWVPKSHRAPRMYLETPCLILGVHKRSRVWPKPFLLMHAIDLSEMTELWRVRPTWSRYDKHVPGTAELGSDVTRGLQLSTPPSGCLNENGPCGLIGTGTILKVGRHGLGLDVALLEEMCPWWWALRFQGFQPRPSVSSLPCCLPTQM